MKREIQQKLNLNPASHDDYATIENMWRYYVYDMGRYCGFTKGWECPVNLSFVSDDLTHYFTDPEKKVLLVKVEDQLAGFVFLHQISISSPCEWKICEFFIIAKFQGKGIGQQVAKKIFYRFPGRWTVTAMSENSAAIKFWRKIINEVSCTQFTEVLKTAKELATKEKPNPYAMVVFSFNVNQKI
jgi:predicted acetyltransferase